MATTFLNTLTARLCPAYTTDRTHAEQIALWLCYAVSGISETLIRIDGDARISAAHKEQIAALVDRLIDEDYPLQYLLGSVPFCGLDIMVEPPLLIPRPETEEWVLRLIDQIQSSGKTPRTILDLCTGTGCIALALARAFPQAHVVGIDINPQAVACAQKNSAHTKLNNAEFMVSDLYTTLQEAQFDLIVSNPPYIDENDWRTLAPRVRTFEDRRALVAGDQGYALIEKIIDQAPQHLDPMGLRMLAIEIGAAQGERVVEYATAQGAHAILGYDYHNLPRTVTSVWHTVPQKKKPTAQ